MERRRSTPRAAANPPKASRMQTSHRGRIVAVVATLLAAAGCGSFFGGPEPSGLGSNGVRDTCTWGKNECTATEYCDAPDCSSMGVCRPRPAPLGSGDQSWACGCDGITYWNAKFANAQG